MKRTSTATLILWAWTLATAIAAPPTFLARRDYVTSYVSNALVLADTTGNGILDIIQPGPAVLFGTGNGTFRPGPTSSIGCGGTPVPAELAHKGTIDLALGTGTGVCVSLGNGDGSFQPGTIYPAGTETQTDSLVVGDFNNDGILDLATAGQQGIWLFTGKGGGLLNPGVLTLFTGAWISVWNLAAGDLNGDHKIDLVVQMSTGFAVLLGNGDGTFQPPQYVTTHSGPAFLTIGDVNLDGRADIVLVNDSSPEVSIYFGNESGVQTTPTHVNLPGSTQVAIGDVNGDGIPDLVNSTVYVALGKGNGVFGSPTFYTVEASEGSYNAVLGDLRNNGRNDIVVQGSAVSVLLNLGNGKFQDGESTPVTGGAGCGALADYNRDGKPDLAVNTASGIAILLGTGNAKTPYTTGPPIALPGAGCLITGDLNGDGIPDLLVPFTNSTGYYVNAYLGKGDGTFTLKSSTVVLNPGYLALADFNHDGKVDFATSDNLLAFGNGDGTFQPTVPILSNPPSTFTNIAAADLNGDGWPDLLLVSYGLGVYELLNNRSGGFVPHLLTETGGYNLTVLADLNNDGNVDFVATTDGGGGIVYIGNGKGGFTNAATLPDYLFGIPTIAAVSDVNGDGIPDIILDEGSTVAIFLGKGNAQFQPPFYIGAGPSPASIYVENLHGQSPSAGIPDIIVPDFSTGVTVLINTTK